MEGEAKGTKGTQEASLLAGAGVSKTGPEPVGVEVLLILILHFRLEGNKFSGVQGVGLVSPC